MSGWCSAPSDKCHKWSITKVKDPGCYTTLKNHTAATLMEEGRPLKISVIKKGMLFYLLPIWIFLMLLACESSDLSIAKNQGLCGANKQLTQY